MKPTWKADYASTFHRDGTVSFWDVYRQQWQRLQARDISPEILSHMGKHERNHILRLAKRHAEPWEPDGFAPIYTQTPKRQEERIDLLAADASARGDGDELALCRRALTGDETAWETCLRRIAEAEGSK